MSEAIKADVYDLWFIHYLRTPYGPDGFFCAKTARKWEKLFKSDDYIGKHINDFPDSLPYKERLAKAELPIWIIAQKSGNLQYPALRLFAVIGYHSISKFFDCHFFLPTNFLIANTIPQRIITIVT